MRSGGEISTAGIDRSACVLTKVEETLTGSTETTGDTLYSVTGAGCELWTWQHDPESFDFNSMLSCPVVVCAIMGQSGGQFIEFAGCGEQSARAMSGTAKMAAKMLAETSCRHNRMIAP